MKEERISFWHKKIIWNISVWELTAYVGFYLFQAVLYWLAIRLSSGQNPWDGILLNYGFKVALTIPFWHLFIRKLKGWSFLQKMALHFLACPVYVAIWLGMYYATIDYLGMGRLRGSGVWWDVYIPILNYIVQFAIFHAYDYWVTTQKQQQKQQELIALTHLAEVNALKAQLQPHFLFNTLNSISASVPPSLEHTRELIAKLADMFRHAASVSNKKQILLHEELAFVKNCLELEQKRFKDRLTVYYEVDETLHNLQVPPMILQPLVENAIKHGIGKSITGGTITIKVKREGSKVYFEISDTGAGLNGTELGTIFTKGIGLSNTKERLEKLYNEPIQIKPNAPKGTMVLFAIPLT